MQCDHVPVVLQVDQTSNTVLGKHHYATHTSKIYVVGHSCANKTLNLGTQVYVRSGRVHGGVQKAIPRTRLLMHATSKIGICLRIQLRLKAQELTTIRVHVKYIYIYIYINLLDGAQERININPRVGGKIGDLFSDYW